MKIVVEYNMDDEDDRDKHKTFIKAPILDIFLHLWENQLRDWYKYAEVEPKIEEIRDKYYEMKHDLILNDD